MDLSAEKFIEIVNGLGPDKTEAGQSDQRKSQRVGIRARASIIPLADNTQPTSISIQVRDLSPAGIGFLHDQKMSLDEKFALVLPRAGDTPSVVLCVVAFWQPLARDLFAIGGRFVRVLRDGGDPPLPIQIEEPTVDLAGEIERLHRRAS